MALHKKLDALFALDPDIAILPEAGSRSRLAFPSGATLDYEWMGSIDFKGLGVLARHPTTIKLIEDFDDSIEWIMPLRVTHGPISFNLLAAWVMNHRATNRSIGDRQVEVALQTYEEKLCDSPLVVAGDFNNSTSWDNKKGTADPKNFVSTAAALESLGLVSAYHQVRDVPFGDESEPTLYWRTQKPGGPTFHIDFCFLPERWSREAEVEVGSYEQWIKSGLSDHAPLIIDVDISALN